MAAWYYALLVLGFTLVLQLVAICYHRSTHFQNRSAERWAAASSEALRVSSLPSRVSKKGLLAYRALVLLYVATCLCLLFVLEGGRPLIYLSIWNFVLITVLFALATFASASTSREPNSAKRRFVERVFVVVLEVELPLGLLVSVVYWSMLFPSEKSFAKNAYFEVSVHLVGTVCVLVEFALNRVLLYPERWTWLVALLTVYQQFAVAYDLIVGEEIYPFLSTQTVECLPTAIKVGAAALAFHYLCCVLSHLKERYLMETSVPEFQTQLYDTLMPEF